MHGDDEPRMNHCVPRRSAPVLPLVSRTHLLGRTRGTLQKLSAFDPTSRKQGGLAEGDVDEEVNCGIGVSLVGPPSEEREERTVGAANEVDRDGREEAVEQISPCSGAEEGVRTRRGWSRGPGAVGGSGSVGVEGGERGLTTAEVGRGMLAGELGLALRTKVRGQERSEAIGLVQKVLSQGASRECAAVEKQRKSTMAEANLSKSRKEPWRKLKQRARREAGEPDRTALEEPFTARRTPSAVW